MHKLTPSEASQLTVHEQRYAAQHIKSRGRNQGKLFIALDKVSNTSCSVELFVADMRAWKKKKDFGALKVLATVTCLSINIHQHLLANRLAALIGG